MSLCLAASGAAREAVALQDRQAPPPAAAAPTGNWPQFRGPGAAGMVEGPEPPVAFNGNDGTNLAWRVEIPGLAHASPIVWGERIYVTSAVSEGPPQRYLAELPDTRESLVEAAPHRWVLLALDKHSGTVLWQQTAAEGVPGSGRLRKGSFNNATPATDGAHVIALFGSHGLFCWDADGNLLWHVDLGELVAGWFFDPTVEWGTASSPVIHDGRVIVQADVLAGSFIAAFAIDDGRELWRTERDEISSWATPTVVETPERDEIVTNGGRAIRGYDADTGAELWRLGPSSEIAVPTPVFAAGLVFVGSGYRPTQPFYAVHPGGSGDVSPGSERRPGGSGEVSTGSEQRAGGSGDVSAGSEQRASGQVAWSAPDRGPLLSTPIVVGNYLYLLSRDGTLACFDAATGLPMYRQKIVPAPAAGQPGAESAAAATGEAPPRAPTFSASPVSAGGRLYIGSEDGNVYVVEGGPFLRLAATNPVGEGVFATPAISDGALLVRGLRHLYAFSHRGPSDQ